MPFFKQLVNIYCTSNDFDPLGSILGGGGGGGLDTKSAERGRKRRIVDCTWGPAPRLRILKAEFQNTVKLFYTRGRQEEL